MNKLKINLFLLVIFTKIIPIDCVILLNSLISQTCTSVYCILYDSDLEHFCGFYTIQNKLLLLLLHVWTSSRTITMDGPDCQPSLTVIKTQSDF